MPLPDPTPKPMKPAEYTEHRILESILDQSYGPGDALPPERELARILGVTRPTVREALQRLAREGWVTIAHGKSTRVNDYLSQGGLGLLSTLARYGDHLSHGLVCHLLEARVLILPGAAGLAARKAPGDLLALLGRRPVNPAAADPFAFAEFDWQLQKEMVILAGNPVLRMIFNDFEAVYRILGARYFTAPETRSASLAYYESLAKVLERDPGQAGAVVAEAMARARSLWEEMA